ncbi:MAG TPA: bifunctional homocysteine S-methyltransferase/methylenetetrahydrofolate reductase [Bryobacteraceae bacterium]|nr:bifunctional homocysteine S-methyltransferase/methylenetetrahydrofolate reductase [Bryobacteraceae bacterium]
MPVSAPQTRAGRLREVLGQRVLVADGAMGTMLYAKRAFLHRCYDEMNLSLPAMVRDVHQEYVRAGAEILETNTFGANRKRLQPFGFAEKVRAINHAGVRIAREAARDQAFVAGAVGPLGARLEPLGQVSPEEARAVFREQIAALIEAGIDLLLLETFRDLNELNQAVCAAREISADELIVAVLVSIEDDARLENGASAAEFTRALDQMPVDIVGLNCSSGPRVMLDTIETMARHTNKLLCAMPNAGLPVSVDGRNVYLCSPEYMAEYARRFKQAGVKIVGGCCGTTPEHIQAIHAEIRRQAQGFDAPEHPHSVIVEEPLAPPQPPLQPQSQVMEPVPLAQKSALAARLSAGRFVALVEILPPRGADATQEIAAARQAKAAGFDAVNVPDGPRASARMSAQVACELIQQHAGIEAVLHFNCRDRNVLGLQSDLLGAHAAAVRNLLCITGDPPRMGMYPDATPVFDVDSIGLVRIAGQLNRGCDLGGHALGSQTSLLIGVAADPGALDLDRELRRFEAKAAAGAEFAITQPIFDLNLIEAFLKRAQQFRIPIVAGIWPLLSLGNAEFLVNELRVPVPAEFMERMRHANDGDSARAEGVAIARELIAQIRPMVAGVQLSSPSGHYQMAIAAAEAFTQAAEAVTQAIDPSD